MPAVDVDPNQLEMALLNLAVNARDAMISGGVLTIGLSEQIVEVDDQLGVQPGRYVVLSVRDTGEGMDAETLARAVEPFFSTKGVGKGTGLGLSMVFGLAQQSGGALRLESAPVERNNRQTLAPDCQGNDAAFRTHVECRHSSLGPERGSSLWTTIF